jgi:hypothetical protein
MENEPITIFLDRDAHFYAHEFAAQQINPSKGKQVYLNTLAVCAVDRYLKCLEVKTSLHQSDCWHSGLRSVLDVADLVLSNLGKLQCRPILPAQEFLTLPLEASDDCIGYIGVKFFEELDRVELIGFLPAQNIKEPLSPIALSEFHSLDDLLDRLDRLQRRVKLERWLEGIFEPEWQPKELLLASQGRLLRNIEAIAPTAIARGKIVELDRESLIIIVKASDRSAGEIDLDVQIYAYGDRGLLPLGLKAILLDESGTPCLQAEAGNNDNWIQLQFSCHKQESFSLNLSLGESEIVEEFLA